MGSSLLDDFLGARDLPGELVSSARDFEARVQVCRRIYRDEFADTTVGNPGEFQAVMVMLKMWQDQGSLDVSDAEWGEKNE